MFRLNYAIFAVVEIQPIAYFESPMKSKFGIPRQSGLVPELPGRIVFVPAYRRMEAVRGMDDFDYLWLIWEFSGNHPGGLHSPASAPKPALTVRPPRLGGNTRLGVFATRSPFRPNPLGLSCVELDRVEEDPRLGPVIYVWGADLMDGTPIYDIKPYVAYADAHPDVRSGFVDRSEWQLLQVCIPDNVAARIPKDHLEALRATLAQDPRPQYHHDEMRIYGMSFLNLDIRFRVAGNVLTVVDCIKI